jgi:hypothetical protein
MANLSNRRIEAPRDDELMAKTFKYPGSWSRKRVCKQLSARSANAYKKD